ncbi:MAG: sugar transferase, partial [Clostridia bacterium]|nr:sugar transferase [Clostridia bacterium]
MDIIAATGAIVVLSPVFLLTALAIKIEDGGSPFFTQKRVGKDGKVFKMYKFRSMCVNADKMHAQMKEQAGVTDVSFKLVEDPRITKVGNFIRKFSIDEFPQFINILKGDMSLVGPRPLPVYEAVEVNDEFQGRYQLNPGLTCLWQI